MNGSKLATDEYYEPVDPDHAWGTAETLGYLHAAITDVHDLFPGTPPLPVGHLSARGGGRLSPHLSHQSGRDVDIGFFYLDQARWYRRADATNLDLPRTWAFVRALVTESDVEMILIDRSIQALLRRHAVSIGEDEAWLASLFDGKLGSMPPIFRHARGHRTHLHVRFHNPIAQESARRLYPLLVEHDMIEPLSHVVHHRVSKGETLGKLAKRFGTTVKAIMRANGLRSTLIQARRVYRIPRSGPPPDLGTPVAIPERRLPPSIPETLLGRPKASAGSHSGGRPSGVDVADSARN
jgi:penicillin-insensitive murein endopeptidase